MLGLTEFSDGGQLADVWLREISLQLARERSSALHTREEAASFESRDCHIPVQGMKQCVRMIRCQPCYRSGAATGQRAGWKRMTAPIRFGRVGFSEDELGCTEIITPTGNGANLVITICDFDL